MTAADLLTFVLLAVVLTTFVRWCCCNETSPVDEPGLQGVRGGGPVPPAAARPGDAR